MLAKQILRRIEQHGSSGELGPETEEMLRRLAFLLETYLKTAKIPEPAYALLTPQGTVKLEWDKILEDLKAGRVTDRVKYFLKITLMCGEINLIIGF